MAAFAERVDLMRAFIVGPPGTPYEDAVFVFDLQLPCAGRALQPPAPRPPPAASRVSA